MPPELRQRLMDQREANYVQRRNEGYYNRNRNASDTPRTWQKNPKWNRSPGQETVRQALVAEEDEEQSVSGNLEEKP